VRVHLFLEARGDCCAKESQVSGTMAKINEDGKELLLLESVLFEQKLGQVGKSPNEKDRLRLIRNITLNFILTADQAYELLSKTHEFSALLDGAELVYPVVKDEEKDHFIFLGVNKLCKYPEDRQAFCERLGVEVQEPEKRKSGPKVKVATFDKQDVAGYTG